jgi:hypothetical protein
MDAAALVAELRSPTTRTARRIACCEELREKSLSMAECADAIAAVVEVLQSCNDPTLQRQSCRVLSQLAARSMQNQVAAGAVGAIAAVVAMMRANPRDTDTLCLGCLALGNICFSIAENQEKAGDAAVAVTEALLAHPAHATLQHYGCNALAIITKDHQRNKVNAGIAGAVAAVLAAMRACRGAAKVQQSGCLVLGILVCDVQQNRTCAIQAGAFATLVDALTAHAGCAGVQANGCCALGGLVRDDDHSCNPPIPDGKRLAAKAAPLAVAALTAHRAYADVQAWAGYAIWVLSKTAYLGVRISRDGVRAIVAALRAHRTHSGVQRYCCEALSIVISGNATNIAAATNAGAFEAVKAAMQSHPAEAEVQFAGCSVFSSLGQGQQAKAHHIGAVDVVCAAMRAHPADALVQRNGCMALACIVCKHREKLQAACAAGAIEAVVAAANPSLEHLESCTAYETAGVTLKEIIWGGHAQEDAALRAGALEALSGGGEAGTYEADRRHVVARLELAARWHDAGVCTHHATCKRCAGMRAAGTMCALAGCCARMRDARKKLLRCGRCGVACYCGAAHQRDDWARHKAECRRPSRDDDDEEEDDEDDGAAE